MSKLAELKLITNLITGFNKEHRTYFNPSVFEIGSITPIDHQLKISLNPVINTAYRGSLEFIHDKIDIGQLLSSIIIPNIYAMNEYWVKYYLINILKLDLLEEDFEIYDHYPHINDQGHIRQLKVRSHPNSYFYYGEVSFLIDQVSGNLIKQEDQSKDLGYLNIEDQSNSILSQKDSSGQIVNEITISTIDNDLWHIHSLDDYIKFNGDKYLYGSFEILGSDKVTDTLKQEDQYWIDIPKEDRPILPLKQVDKYDLYKESTNLIRVIDRETNAMVDIFYPGQLLNVFYEDGYFRLAYCDLNRLTFYFKSFKLTDNSIDEDYGDDLLPITYTVASGSLINSFIKIDKEYILTVDRLEESDLPDLYISTDPYLPIELTNYQPFVRFALNGDLIPEVFIPYEPVVFRSSVIKKLLLVDSEIVIIRNNTIEHYNLILDQLRYSYYSPNETIIDLIETLKGFYLVTINDENIYSLYHYNKGIYPVLLKTSSSVFIFNKGSL